MEHFDKLKKNDRSFSEGRRGFPETVFYYLKIFAKEEENLLDLGCGAGISTRQMVLNGFQEVQGLDRDPLLLDEAREHATYKYIPYWCAEASNTHFRTQYFHGITCFTSFHRFTKDPIISELRRILKPKGFLFIVRKEDITTFKEEIKVALEKELNQTFSILPSVSEIEKSLVSYKFRLESTKAFEGEDLYSLAEAIDYIKSTPFWLEIEEAKRDQLLKKIVVPKLEDYLEVSKREKNRIIRRYNAVCIVAHKT